MSNSSQLAGEVRVGITEAMNQLRLAMQGSATSVDNKAMAVPCFEALRAAQRLAGALESSLLKSGEVGNICKASDHLTMSFYAGWTG